MLPSPDPSAAIQAVTVIATGGDTTDFARLAVFVLVAGFAFVIFSLAFMSGSGLRR